MKLIGSLSGLGFYYCYFTVIEYFFEHFPQAMNHWGIKSGYLLLGFGAFLFLQNVWFKLAEGVAETLWNTVLISFYGFSVFMIIRLIEKPANNFEDLVLSLLFPLFCWLISLAVRIIKVYWSQKKEHSNKESYYEYFLNEKGEVFKMKI